MAEERQDALLEAADLLLQRLKGRLEAEEALESQELRSYTATLKDLMRIRGVRAGDDQREQEARIQKLLREAEPQKAERTVSVVLSGDLEVFAQ